MAKYTLVDCETGLIYGAYETYTMVRASAEGKALATWEIIKGDGKRGGASSCGRSCL
jgi:hypothetical protein